MHDGSAPGRGLAVLTQTGAEDLLAAAVETMGGSLLDWSATQVDDRPGTGTTVAYRTQIRWPEGERTETWGARWSPRPLPDTDPAGTVRMSDGVHTVQVWRFPADPALPGLSSLVAGSGAADLLRTIGADPDGAAVRVVGYRPGRRAVLEVVSRSHRVFVKALRPDKVAGVHDRLVRCRRAELPTPRSLGWTEDGLLVLEPLPGTVLRDEIRRYGARACPPSELNALLDRLPAELADLPRRPAWSESTDHFAHVVSAAAPELADRATAIAGAVTDQLDDLPPESPSHGDFYEAQILAQGGAITGMLDVDTAGPGRRVDDLACLAGHLSVLITMAPADSQGPRQALAAWLPELDRHVDPRQLRVRAAGVVLSLATGPFRTRERHAQRSAQRRLAMAEEWLAAAGAGRRPDFENPLIGASEPLHQRRPR